MCFSLFLTDCKKPHSWTKLWKSEIAALPRHNDSVTPPTHDFRYLQLFLIFTMFPSPRSSNPSHSYTVTHHILSSHMVRLFYAKIKWRFLLKVSEIHQFQRDWLTAEITWLVIRFTESHSAVGGCFAHQAPCKICMFNRAFAALQLSPA